MKSASIKYLLKEGLRNIRVNKLMSIASVTVLMSCLMIIGTAIMIYVNINAILTGIEEQNVVIVYVEDNATKAATEALGRSIKNLPNVKDCEFIPREKGMEEIRESFGDE
ncbi:MAG: permease-like cell division protein FtsX, partial [Oscillospiraceae bacterium]|nr:permease-like cell division protein FtsX [Oscillospiraceae bacterium]